MKTLQEITDYYGPLLAKAAFELGAIKLSPDNPFTWVSGYRMPIYNDNRQFLAKASNRALICDAFADMTDALGLGDIENIAGTATAGIPHSTSLADPQTGTGDPRDPGWHPSAHPSPVVEGRK